MSLYESLIREVDKGMAGKNGSIPFPLAKMDEYLDVAKNTNYLFVGDTGLKINFKIYLYILK